MGSSALVLLCLSTLPLLSQASVNFNQCLDNIKDGTFGPIGLNSLGQPTNTANATAVSYHNCVEFCGAGQEPFNWSTFSQEFSSWLLPWLALISQLPFGTNDKLINLEAMLLSVGSPMLAAYSLALTVLNGRWIARRFRAYRYPNVRHAVRVLSSLQQSPLKVSNDEALLASLIVLPHNDDWWEELVGWLDYTYTWSISAATSIAWVVIAYIFTVIDSFTGDIEATFQSHGVGVGSLWLWLITIVVGWLQISPKCDSDRLRKAVEKANGMAYVAKDSGESVRASTLSDERAICLDFTNHDPLRIDEQCTAPIFNYARFLSWVQAVEVISDAYAAACNNAQRHRPVNRLAEWADQGKGEVLFENNRLGNSTEVADYCEMLSMDKDVRSRWGSCTLSHMFIASGMALLLQWGTAGGAVLNAWFTPTRGLGCRSGSYVVYAAVSTISWILLVISSIFSHCATTTSSGRHRRPTGALRFFSIALRRLGKLIASLNAIWIVVSCMFQFTSFFDRCYCNSSVFWLGLTGGYNVITLAPEDLSIMRTGWSAGIALSGGSAFIFVVFVNLLINPTLPEQ